MFVQANPYLPIIGLAALWLARHLTLRMEG